MKKSVFKVVSFIPALLLITTCVSGCSGNDNDNEVLRILNAADYIYEYNKADVEAEEDCSYAAYLKDQDMVDQFVSFMASQGRKVSIVYDTYDTNETMYNEIMTGKSSYDLLVASDYMVQKLISNDLVQPLPSFGHDIEFIHENVAPYLLDIFDNIHPKDPKNNEYLTSIKLTDYSIPYMWGTIGILYNPSFFETKLNYEFDEIIDDFTQWDCLYSKKYNNTFSIKDSVRDVYAVSVIHSFYDDEIVPLENKLENEEISKEEFNHELNKIFNRCDDETLKIIKDDINKLKDNSFGFEVDSGKTDMAEGKLGANLAWSGDATWAIEQAEDEYEKELYFSIPKEGSNIWFDAFCVPKTSNKLDLATAFISFMCDPSNALQNMWSVGYTSSIANSITLDYIYECYDVREEVGGEIPLDAEYVDYDLSYFFKDCVDNPSDAVLKAYPETIGRTLTAQFPNQDDLPRLCVMDDFGTQNKAVINMWEKVRTNPLPLWAIIILIIELVVAIAVVTLFAIKKHSKNKLIKMRRKERNIH